MSKILIKNIKGLVQAGEEMPRYRKGADMKNLPIIENAFLAIEDGQILAYGKMEDWGGIDDWRDLEIIDADGKYVMPAFCDSHTHAVFAKTREGEYVDRINGLTYQEIAAKGGGILNSAKKLQATPEDDLYDEAFERLNRLRETGTGAIEIKSGYGLTVDAELKMLRVIKRLKANSELTIKSTFLGAHAFPNAYKEDHAGYIELIVDDMLPAIEQDRLADFVDCFCETNYYSVEEMVHVLKAGKKHGLTPKVHVNQFTVLGAVQAAIKEGALSVDHLEEISDADIEALKNSECMPTVLPGCSYFISIPFGQARKMIDAGLPLAIASDYNPGSAPSGNVPFLMSLACTKMKMTPEETINAVTLNSAYAMGVEDKLGSITVGKKANVIITKKMDSLAYIPYSFGENSIETTILNGKI